MISTKTTIVAALLAGVVAHAGAEGVDRDRAGDITVDVSGLRNTRGDVVAALFRSPDGFPDGRYAFRSARVPVTGRSVSFAFAAVPSGEYAVALFHDENRNQKLDTGLFGIPREGYGASRNDLPRFSAPTWKGNRFPVAAGETVSLRIGVRY